jgi:pilus assembly protein CpaF
MICSSIDVVVQAARLRDGSRRITAISEVLGMEGDVIVTQDIFLYDILGEDQSGNLMGRHRSTGITKPQFTERAKYFNEEANLIEALEKSDVEQRELLNN